MYKNHFHDNGEPFSPVAKAMRELLQKENEKKREREAVLKAVKNIKKVCLNHLCKPGKDVNCSNCPLTDKSGIDCLDMIMDKPEEFVDALFAKEEMRGDTDV